MDATTLSNLGAYSAQIACIALAGALLPLLFRIDAAGVRYAYWRALLALCVLLPWLQGREAAHALVVSEAPATVGTVSMDAPAAGLAMAAAAGFDWMAAAGVVLLAGIAIRVMWVGVALRHLRRLRACGTVAPLTPEFEDAQQTIGTRAEIRYVAGLAQPVTFGAWRPVVLLPETLRAHDAAIQRAVLCHELFHVQRRDWIWVLAEEAVRAALWFHPAIWWLISRVQLAREEAVDELAVLATGRRRTYVEALLAFADDAPLAPAAAFARRRHLFRRMVLISKEAVMSSKRIVLSSAAMALVVAVGSWSAVGAFPMTGGGALQQSTQPLGPGPLEKAAKPVTPENPIPRRVNASDPVYPAEAAGTRGMVTLSVTLDQLGRVAEARPIGINLHRDAPQGFSIGYENAATFDLEMMFSGSRVTGQARVGGAATDFDMLRIVANAFIESSLQAVRQWRYDPPADAPIAFDVRIVYSPTAPAATTQSARGARGAVAGFAGSGVMGGVAGGVPGGVGGAARSSGTGVGTGAGEGSGAGQGPVRVGGNIKAPTKIQDVRPVYPPEAQANRVQGVVIIEALIDTDGSVANARILRSIPMLDQAAVDTVLQWRFTPTLLNGQAVQVIMTTTVNFTLQ